MRDMRGILLFVMMAMALGACASQPAATKKAVSSDTAVMAKSDKRSARPAAIDTTPAPSFARDAGFDQPFALQQIAFSSSHRPDLGGPLLAQASDQARPEGEAEMSDVEIAAQLNNPVGNLWQLVMQNDMIIRDIEGFGDNQVLNNFKFQPVMPIPLTDEWRVIVRPVFSLNAYDIPQVPSLPSGGPPSGGSNLLPGLPPPLPPGFPGGSFDTNFGLGDTVFLTAFSNSPLRSKWQYGFGPTWMFPTATDDTLGARKWAVGPGGALVYLGRGAGDVIAGGLVQHWKSFAGPGDADVNLTDIQYVFKYNVTDTFSVGFAPNIQYDWENDDLSLPVGGGLDFTLKIGDVPMKLALEAHYYPVTFDGLDNQWNFRLLLSPVLPAPKFAQKPLF